MKEIFARPFRLFLSGKEGVKELKGKKAEAATAAIMEFLSYGHPMPALGVSLHEETVRDMEQTPYLIFEFEREVRYEGYSFEALALKLFPETYGGTFLRRKDGRWEGRCLYWSGERAFDGGAIAAWYEQI